MNKILENNTPDKVIYQNKELKWNHKDARSFGFIGDICCISDYKGRHPELLKKYNKEIGDCIKGNVDILRTIDVKKYRKGLYYTGRLWDDKKIISFWFYPESNEKLKELLDLLKKEDKSINIHFVSLPYNEFVSVDKYENNSIIQDTDIDHLDTTRKKKVPSGIGSKKNKPIELKYRIYQE